MALFGKVDIGAGVLRRFGPAPTQDGYHGGASLPIVTRAADVRRPTKPNPLELVDDHAAHVHPEDWKVRHLATSRDISPRLATSRHVSPRLATSRHVSPRLNWYGLISPRLATSQLVWPHLATSRHVSACVPLQVHDRCSEWLRAKGDASRSSGGGGGPPWFLYCSLNIPHPAFRTNATWLHAVDEAAVRASPPAWPAEGSMHPYDACG